MDLKDGRKTNVFKQKQANYNSIFIGLESGDITANQLRTIAQITQRLLRRRISKKRLLTEYCYTLCS